jgi:hypothetical protein
VVEDAGEDRDVERLEPERRQVVEVEHLEGEVVRLLTAVARKKAGLLGGGPAS